MGIFHCKLKNHSRNGGKNAKAPKGSKGAPQLKSVVAKAAYRAGEDLYDERYETTHRYGNRQATGDILHTGIYTRAGDAVPEWVQNRQELWNKVEAAENRKDARLAKEVVLALPYELSPAEMVQNVENYVASTITRYGAVADVCIHGYGRGYNPDDKNKKQAEQAQEKISEWKGKNIPFLTREEAEKSQSRHVKIETDQHGAITGYKLYQPHAHVMMTTRAMTADGFENTKCNYLNRKEQLYNWRYGWEQQLNQSFKNMGLDIRVSAAKNEPAANDDDYCTDGRDNEKIMDFAYQLQHLKLGNREAWQEAQRQKIRAGFALSDNQKQEAKAKPEKKESHKSVTTKSITEAMQQFMQQGQALNSFNLCTQHPNLTPDQALSLQFMQWGKDYDRRAKHQQTRPAQNNGYTSKDEREQGR